MSNVLWFPNLSKVNTGTAVGAKQCLDVAPQNTVGTPLFVSQVSGSGGAILETRYHDAASTQINDSGGAFVQINTAAALANDISEIRVASTLGEPVAIGVGANAGAAASNIIAVLNRGDGPVVLPVALVTGAKIWVRSLSSVAVTAGELTLNLVG